GLARAARAHARRAGPGRARGRGRARHDGLGRALAGLRRGPPSAPAPRLRAGLSEGADRRARGRRAVGGQGHGRRARPPLPVLRAYAGRLIVHDEPPPESFLPSARPLWAAAIFLTMARPSPKPRGLVVAKGSKSSGRNSAFTPGPVSDTVTEASLPEEAVLTVSVPPSAMASTALSRKRRTASTRRRSSARAAGLSLESSLLTLILSGGA